MAHTSGIENEFVPTIGTILRFSIDRHAMWLQFFPMAAATVWALWYFRRNRGNWSWHTHGSLLIFVSVLASPYSWFTDQAILLPALLQAAHVARKGSLLVFFALLSAYSIDMFTAASMHSVLFLGPLIGCFAWYMWSYMQERNIHEPPIPFDGAAMSIGKP